MMIRATLSVSLLVFGFAGYSTTSQAETIDAASGSSVDIQAAVDLAQPGDTVLIPEGSFDFEGQVFATDGIKIAGMGRDKTFLIKRDRLEQWNAMINVDCLTGEPFEFSGITLQGLGRFLQPDTDASGVGKSGMEKGPIRDIGLYLQGACVGFQVHDSRFTKFTRAGVQLRGNVGTKQGAAVGVIYRNEFFDNWYPGLGYGVEIVGHRNSWDSPVELGTTDVVVIEDNRFEKHRHTVAANNGARYVFRFNHILNNYQDAAAIDAHGLASWPRGTRSYEIYENRVDNSIKRWAGVAPRGGSGVIFNNVFNGVNHGIVLMIEKYDKRMRYPVPDQINDLWIWNNFANGTIIQKPDFMKSQKRAKKLIRKGRNYHLKPKPDYVPLAYPHPMRAARSPS
ncbi:MAG: hypothetical protein ACTSX7_09650 [Alphaproteobacteria bacterium]